MNDYTRYLNKALRRECPEAHAHGDGRSSASAIHDLRRSRKDLAIAPGPSTRPPGERYLSRSLVIPLGPDHQESASRWGESQRPRVKNWTYPEAAKKRGISEYDNGHYSRRCTYTHWTYTARLRSCGLVLAHHLVYWGPDDGAMRVIAAPRGWEWTADANGIYIQRVGGGCDYHPTSDDLVQPRPGYYCAGRARENARVRAAAARQEAARRKAEKISDKRAAALVRRAESEGALVCLRDSLAAGNCRAGSEAWAVRHGLNPSLHVKPSDILSRANGDYQRVSLVVAVALRRHEREMRDGYALLAEHEA